MTEFSTKGIQSLWAPDKYFRVDGNDPNYLVTGKGSLRFMSGNGNYGLYVSDAGIRLYKNGSWTTL
jgi:hypothetical protein